MFRYIREWFGGLLSLLLPLVVNKENNLVVLTAFHGYGYRGNTRALYEGLILCDQLRAVWLSRDPQIVDLLNRRYGAGKAERMHSFRGLKLLAASSALLFTHGTSDFAFLRLPRRSLRIQTYHGLPTKRGEFLRPASQKKPGWVHRFILRYRFEPISFFLSSSPLVSRLFSQRFGIAIEKFIETGYPAYDEFFKNNSEPLLPAEVWPSSPEADGIILYAPTFRRKERTRWFPFDHFDFTALHSFLEEKKLLLVLRQHPNDTQDLSRFTSHSPRIVLADQSFVEDVTTLLQISKGIISDYSSITLEGSLKDIPSIYIPYDLISYERGLILPYSEMTAGPVVTSGTQFLAALRSITENPEQDSDKRLTLRTLFMKQEQGNSTGNVIRFLKARMLS
ncbi:MAG: hypothetical protein EA360_10940 [Balneolaceae bacterium]|nr:MAG: hypothetical protein EA360_10940 [Balneolaceae bacterium]